MVGYARIKSIGEKVDHLYGMRAAVLDERGGVGSGNKIEIGRMIAAAIKLTVCGKVSGGILIRINEAQRFSRVVRIGYPCPDVGEYRVYCPV